MTGDAEPSGCRCRGCSQRAGHAADGINFRVLGPVEASVGGTPMPLSGPRQRAVLAALVLGAGRVVSAERLVQAVWEGAPPPTRRLQIQAAISRLRRGMPGLILTRGPGYLLAVEPEQADALVFRRLARDGRSAVRGGYPGEGAALLRSALSLWRGRALDGAPGLAADAASLEELRVDALEALYAAEVGIGRLGDIVAELYQYVVKLPWRDSLRGLLMLALYGSGRKADALTIYWGACQVPGQRGRAVPGPALRRLRQLISRDDPSLASPFTVAVALSRCHCPGGR